ncbi:transglutaminase-like cysteine peptidase [Tianweitania populi]|uniref:Transglutaminase n=1 Tax=Tianweitania populi TaxID=1607949 RepID=A0A8J3DYN9_9HYPH|nr:MULTISPECIES: transglutaminase-like cysteine peptidase [Tianweitania]GHD13167.1 hypothetical protein GCM10016234_18390 [Tianweitania populi]
MIRCVIVLAVLLGCAACSETTSSIGAPSTMKPLGFAFAPPGFYPFCDEQPRLCSTNGASDAMTMTPARMAELKAVNTSVNRGFKQRDDKPGLSGDQWGMPTADAGGDCEDLAIMKKAELLKRGWPASTLLLTVGTLNGAGHAVLTVRTSKGDLVLDNMTDAIKPWSRTPYKYFARQKPNAGGGSEWTRIDS